MVGVEDKKFGQKVVAVVSSDLPSLEAAELINFTREHLSGYKLPKEIIPDSESLKDTYERVLKYFKDEIQKKLIKDNVLIYDIHIPMILVCFLNFSSLMKLMLHGSHK